MKRVRHNVPLYPTRSDVCRGIPRESVLSCLNLKLCNVSAWDHDEPYKSAMMGLDGALKRGRIV